MKSKYLYQNVDVVSLEDKGIAVKAVTHDATSLMRLVAEKF